MVAACGACSSESRTHEFDAVVDLDAAVRDPGDPERLAPDLDRGDHLHPNDAGYARSAAAVSCEQLELGGLAN